LNRIIIAIHCIACVQIIILPSLLDITLPLTISGSNWFLVCIWTAEREKKKERGLLWTWKSSREKVIKQSMILF